MTSAGTTVPVIVPDVLLGQAGFPPPPPVGSVPGRARRLTRPGPRSTRSDSSGMISAMRLVQMTLLAFVSLPGFQAFVGNLSPSIRAEVVAAQEWHVGCPVTLSQLRVLTVVLLEASTEARTGTAGRQRGGGRAGAHRRCSRRLYAHALPDPSHGALGHLRAGTGPSGGRRRDRLVRVPPGIGITLHRYREHGHRQLVGARIRRGDRPQPGRQPLRRLRDDPRREGAVVPRSSADATRNGHAGRRRGVPRGGLGWGGDWSGSTQDYMHFSATGH